MNTQYEYICKCWWCHHLTKFPFNLSTDMTEISYFSYDKVTCLISTLNKCRIMFTLIYSNMGTCSLHVCAELQIFKILFTKYMEKSEAMTSSTHSFEYSYWLFKKCFVKYSETLKKIISSVFLIWFSSNFHCFVWILILSIELIWIWTGLIL